MAPKTARVICLCQCKGECGTRVQLTREELLDVARNGYGIIAKKCPNGPESGDEFIEEHTDYIVYEFEDDNCW